ncbi:MAG: hypothetical protein ACHQ0I_03195 [Candidatus Lutacidiplasmatales archaeon]
MPFPRPEVDIRSPPLDFDELVEWLERWSYRLVLLEEYPLHEIRSAIEAAETAVRGHRLSYDPWVLALSATEEGRAGEARVILSDHEWFVTSLDQFWWFFHVVSNEDHGGHRQALGQYGRVLAEALRRHRRDERPLERQLSRSGALGGPAPEATLIS